MTFVLNSIELVVLAAHSSHLLQVFDVFVAYPVRTSFKQELAKPVGRITHPDPEQ
jgi:hypothetical protein